MATLAVYRGDQLLRKVELGEAPMRIGRAPENEIVLDDSNKGVSRTHAEIRHEEGRYVILDLNSQNGVWIRDRRVKVEPLPTDEPVTVGPYRLVLLPTAAPPASSTSIPGTMVASAPRGPAPAEPAARIEAAAQPSPKQESKPAPPVPPAPAPPKPKPAPAPAKASSPAGGGGANKILVIAGIAGAVIAAVAVFAMLSGGSSSQPETPPAEAPPPVAQATSTVPPPQPTDEERFRDHFDKAQAFIAAGDKANATVENTAALAILANDERGLKQRAEIDKIGAPPATAVAETPGVATAPTSPTAKTKKDALASSLAVAPRPNESPADRAAREKNARYLLDDGKRAFDERRFADAIELLQRAIDLSDRPDFGSAPGEAASALKQARTAKAAADAGVARASAQKLLDQAKALAGTDLVGAVRRLREAQALDQKLPADQKLSGVSELLATLQEQALAQGEAALTSAKNFDRVKRVPDAIREYDRAIQLLELAGGHKELAVAKQRSADLKR